MKKYLAVKSVKPTDDFKLILIFSNGEKRLFDMKPYLNKGIFKSLKNIDLFNTVHVSFDTVEWDNEADIDPEILYNDSNKIKEEKYSASHSTVKVFAEPKSVYKKKR